MVRPLLVDRVCDGESPGRYQWGLPGDVPISRRLRRGRPDGFHGLPAGDRRVADPLLVDRVCDGQCLWSIQWGRVGDIPLVEDFDGDGQAELTVYRPSTGEWWIRYSSLGYSAVTFGLYQWGVAERYASSIARSSVAVFHPRRSGVRSEFPIPWDFVDLLVCWDTRSRGRRQPCCRTRRYQVEGEAQTVPSRWARTASVPVGT